MAYKHDTYGSSYEFDFARSRPRRRHGGCLARRNWRLSPITRDGTENANIARGVEPAGLTTSPAEQQ
jgi:hypothetical protein